LQPKQKGF